MGDNDASGAKFTPMPPFGTPRGPTVYATQDPLRSIFAYIDEYSGPEGKRLAGSIAFRSAANKRETATLAACWFPPGAWGISTDTEGEIMPDSVQWLYPPNRTPAQVKEVLRRAGQQKMLLWISEDAAALKRIDEMVRAAAYQFIRVVVAYQKHKSGNSESLPLQRPTDADVGVLADPEVALVYLQFVEHFGKVSVDLALAKDGLTRVELDQVEQDRPPIIEITNLFTQAAAEFLGVRSRARPPSPGIGEMRMMIETIFYQKAAKNDLAARNLLQIAIGGMVTRESGASSIVQDIGISQRDYAGASMLLYDRFGRALRSAGGGYMDSEYRSVDMAKASRDLGIDGIHITVDNKGLYIFLRALEQQLGEPNREFAVMAVSLFRYWQYIRDFITAEYKAEIRARILEFGAMAVGFFVAHAIALRLLPHPAAALFLLLLKGAGMMFAVDFTFSNVALLLEAGSHFARLEENQRLEATTGQKMTELTGLSRFHLLAGSQALLRAMEEIIAMGAVVVGGATIAGGVKYGPALVRGLAKTPARVRLILEEGKAVVAKVEAMMGKTEIETVKNAKPEEQTGSISKKAEPAEPKPGEPKPNPAEPKPAAAEPFEAPRDIVGKPNAYATETQRIEPPPPAPKLTVRELLLKAIGEDRLAVLERDAKRVLETFPDLALTEDEIIALRGYTSDKTNATFGDKDYAILNRALRENDKDMLELFGKYIELIDSALQKLPVEQPAKGILQREIRLGREEAAELFRVGEEFRDPGFFSSSEGRPPKDMNVKIAIKGVNKHGRKIEKVSSFGHVLEQGAKLNELEFLFPKGTRFKVVFYKDFGASIVVTLEHL